LKSLTPILNKIHNIANDIENGKIFSDSIENYPRIFSRAYIAAIKSGERSGKLPEVLNSLAEFIDRREVLKNKLKTILTYPIVLFSVAIFGIIFLLIYVLPRFVNIFKTLGVTSATVNILVFFTNILQNFALPILAIFFIAVFATYIIFKTINKPEYFDYLKIKIPFIGALITKVNISIFANTLQILLDSGNAVVDSVKIAANAVPNRYISQKILVVIPFIENGEPLNKALEKSGQFSDLALHLIYVGERSGTLSEMLKKVNTFYSREVEFTVSETLAIIEPLILVILGLIVCLIAMSIFLPINDFIRSLQRR
ncbi:MAG TPA: type II secretion system F family protein, partial [bacterium]|nr:type II secretion system F family protein [bacterium]